MTNDKAPRWTLALPLAVLTAMVAGAPEYRLYGAFPAACVFTAMQWLLPKCRFRQDNYFTPVNLALFLMLLKLVVSPALIMLVGPQHSVLSSIPSMNSMEGALAIDTITYIALCVGLALIKPPAACAARLHLATPDNALVLAFAGIGLIGFFAEFKSFDRLILYFIGPYTITEIQQEVGGTLLGMIATFFRPFLAFALVAWWSRLADRNCSVWLVTLAAFVASIGVVLANMTFNFNRAAFVFPLLALAAVYHTRIRRIPWTSVVWSAVLFLPLLMALSTYRSNLMAGVETTHDAALRSIPESIADNVQGYAVGAQFTGLFYDNVNWGQRLYGGSTLISSLLSPVPILGKSFREGNGPTLYNRAIYGIDGIEDQILPFGAELFANFHLPGVLIGFVMLGFLLGKSEQWIAAADSGFAAFALQYAAIWAAMLTAWSVAIFSQILIYFFGPIYLYVAASHAQDWLRRVTGSQRFGMVAR